MGQLTSYTALSLDKEAHVGNAFWQQHIGQDKKVGHEILNIFVSISLNIWLRFFWVPTTYG